MTEAAGSFENYGVNLRNRIQHSLYNPMSSLEFLASHWSGEYKPPDNMVVVSHLTIEKAQDLYDVVRDELTVAESKEDVILSHWLEEDLHPCSKKQTTFDHELEHIRTAASLGVDLDRSRLELFFLVDGFGLQLTHSFHPPHDIDPVVKIRTALAPEIPSSGDIAVVQQELQQLGAKLFDQPELLKELTQLILPKTGRSAIDLIDDNI